MTDDLSDDFEAFLAWLAEQRPDSVEKLGLIEIIRRYEVAAAAEPRTREGEL